jgi:hypothetical protein
MADLNEPKKETVRITLPRRTPAPADGASGKRNRAHQSPESTSRSAAQCRTARDRFASGTSHAGPAAPTVGRAETFAPCRRCAGQAPSYSTHGPAARAQPSRRDPSAERSASTRRAETVFSPAATRGSEGAAAASSAACAAQARHSSDESADGKSRRPGRPAQGNSPHWRHARFADEGDGEIEQRPAGGHASRLGHSQRTTCGCQSAAAGVS